MNFFIPGTHPDLSKAELTALDPYLTLPITEKGVFIGQPSRPLGDLLNASAGIVKAGTIFSAVGAYDKATIASLLFATIEPGSTKVNVGISVYDAQGKAFETVQQDRERLGLELKTLLKETGRPVRLVTSKEPTLSAVVIEKNHLLDQGAEFVLIVTQDGILLGETTFVQDFEAWGARDFGRPARDAKSGMLPPKLARLMVNLTGIKPESSRLWDPFCGSGTILMEAALLGYQEIIGSDLSEKAIDDSERNLAWLERASDVTSETTLLVHDATEPLPEELGAMDAIVGEGYLGPSRGPDAGGRGPGFEKVKRELELLYKRALPKILSRLTKEGVAVLALPYFQTQSGNVFLQIEAPKGFTMNRGVLYARPHQHVGRELFTWRRC